MLRHPVTLEAEACPAPFDAHDEMRCRDRPRELGEARSPQARDLVRVNPGAERHVEGRDGAQGAFQAAARLARAEQSQLVGAHVVAAVAEMEHGTAARALNVMRVDRARARGRSPRRGEQRAL
jgi:hypothetical protein